MDVPGTDQRTKTGLLLFQWPTYPTGGGAVSSGAPIPGNPLAPPVNSMGSRFGSGLLGAANPNLSNFNMQSMMEDSIESLRNRLPYPSSVGAGPMANFLPPNSLFINNNNVSDHSTHSPLLNEANRRSATTLDDNDPQSGDASSRHTAITTADSNCQFYANKSPRYGQSSNVNNGESGSSQMFFSSSGGSQSAPSSFGKTESDFIAAYNQQLKESSVQRDFEFQLKLHQRAAALAAVAAVGAADPTAKHVLANHSATAVQASHHHSLNRHHHNHNHHSALHDTVAGNRTNGAFAPPTSAVNSQPDASERVAGRTTAFVAPISESDHHLVGGSESVNSNNISPHIDRGGECTQSLLEQHRQNLSRLMKNHYNPPSGADYNHQLSLMAMNVVNAASNQQSPSSHSSKSVVNNNNIDLTRPRYNSTASERSLLTAAATTTKGYKCKICHHVCFSRHELIDHNTTEHKQDPRPYRCEQCGRQFSTCAYLSQHRRIHSGIRPYACRFCDRRFTQLSHVQQHERIHTGEKPYRCATCTKCFTQMSNLQSHQRQHMKGKPHRCDRCQMAYDLKEELELHTQAKHSGNRYIKILSCPYCSKTYNSETYLAKHIERHKEAGGGGNNRTSAPSAASNTDAWSIAPANQFGSRNNRHRPLIKTELGDSAHFGLPGHLQHQSNHHHQPAHQQHGQQAFRPPDPLQQHPPMTNYCHQQTLEQNTISTAGPAIGSSTSPSMTNCSSHGVVNNPQHHDNSPVGGGQPPVHSWSDNNRSSPRLTGMSLVSSTHSPVISRPNAPPCSSSILPISTPLNLQQRRPDSSLMSGQDQIVDGRDDDDCDSLSSTESGRLIDRRAGIYNQHQHHEMDWTPASSSGPLTSCGAMPYTADNQAGTSVGGTVNTSVISDNSTSTTNAIHQTNSHQWLDNGTASFHHHPHHHQPVMTSRPIDSSNSKSPTLFIRPDSTPNQHHPDHDTSHNSVDPIDQL